MARNMKARSGNGNTPQFLWWWKGRGAAHPLAVWSGLLLCVLALNGCLFTKGRPEPGRLSSSKVAVVSREYLPLSGGQTITPPQKTADVSTLWMPLTDQERRRITRHRQAEFRKMAEFLPGRLAISWLPDSEREVMEEYLFRLTQSHSGITRRSLARAAEYLPMISSVLAEHALPQELAALPLVESAFEPMAVSSAGAAGLWQLMPGTARRFGLVVAPGNDERFNPRKSTEAAAKYLAWLYQHFQDWPVAVAAYNCGEGAMQKAMAGYGVSTLESLASIGRIPNPPDAALKEETLRFVPQFAAAVTVMARSQEYGLTETNQLSLAGGQIAIQSGDPGSMPLKMSSGPGVEESGGGEKYPSLPQMKRVAY